MLMDMMMQCGFCGLALAARTLRQTLLKLSRLSLPTLHSRPLNALQLRSTSKLASFDDPLSFHEGPRSNWLTHLDLVNAHMLVNAIQVR